jgi:hypothetical protein
VISGVFWGRTVSKYDPGSIGVFQLNCQVLLEREYLKSLDPASRAAVPFPVPALAPLQSSLGYGPYQTAETLNAELSTSAPPCVGSV